MRTRPQRAACQQLCSPEYQGRLQAVTVWITVGPCTVAALAAGQLAELLGLRPVMALAVVATVTPFVLIRTPARARWGRSGRRGRRVLGRLPHYRTTDVAETTSAGEAVTLYDVRDVHDVRDARRVAGTADDVFAGMVVNRGGQRDIAGIPSDLYEVRVERRFKGDLRGTVTVSSEPGTPSPDGRRVLVLGCRSRGHRVRLRPEGPPPLSLQAVCLSQLVDGRQ